MEFKSDILVDKSYGLKKENIFISPLSLAFVLAMVANGAMGNTKKEFEEFLGEDIEYSNEVLKEILDDLPNSVEMASSVWTNGVSISPEFQETLNKFYNAEAKTFSAENIEIINNWVKDNTNGKIPCIIDKLAGEVFLLLNAIYFKDDWMTPFRKELTKPRLFKKFDGKMSEVSMMYEKTDFFFENKKAVAFAKDYESKISFIGILPKSRKDFTLESLDIDELLENRNYGKVNIGLPKMEFDSSCDFIEILKAIGINDAFNNKADFSKLADTSLIIDKVFQKASFTVNENGSEAAGVSCVGARKGCMMHEKEIDIILDRPFAFMIYDNVYDCPLFIGKIVNL